VRILIVDDDADIRRLLVQLLEHYRVKDIVEAKDGEQARAILQSTPIHGMIVDQLMPKVDGLELVKEVRGGLGRPGLPVFVLSAVADSARVAAMVETGIDGYLLKPVNPLENGRRLAAFVDLCRMFERQTQGSTTAA